jgi:hypothetical protein
MAAAAIRIQWIRYSITVKRERMQADAISPVFRGMHCDATVTVMEAL